jgi:hypothetical protein
MRSSESIMTAFERPLLAYVLKSPFKGICTYFLIYDWNSPCYLRNGIDSSSVDHFWSLFMQARTFAH